MHRPNTTFGTVIRHEGGGGRVLTEAEAAALLDEQPMERQMAMPLDPSETKGAQG